jgi:hypothetical protein
MVVVVTVLKPNGQILKPDFLSVGYEQVPEQILQLLL